MEIIKTIKTEEKDLKDFNFKVISLNCNDGEDDFIFLNDYLTESLKEKLKENKINIVFDLNVYYSLSCSQGDGFMFEGTFIYKDCLFGIKHKGFYYHENSKIIELQQFKNKYVGELTKKEEETAYKIEEEFNSLYVNICKEMEKIGYSIIEETEEENILRKGFINFLESNNIEETTELYEILNLKYKIK